LRNPQPEEKNLARAFGVGSKATSIRKGFARESRWVVEPHTLTVQDTQS